MNTTGPVMLVYEHVGTVVHVYDYKGGPCEFKTNTEILARIHVQASLLTFIHKGKP